jgi:hypothetical protein
MNLSSPEYCSYNDAVDTLSVRKLTMTSPLEIGHAIVDSGRRALIAKLDIVDAFKLIPAAKDEWNFFGFQWLGKYFADVTTPFGSKTAPANFDYLAETIVNIVKSQNNTPENCVFRQLDDISIVAPRDSKFAEDFVASLQKICFKINVPLAEMCPNHEKAFLPSTFGNILGIEFCTETLSWKLPVDKRLETLQQIKNFFNAKVISLLDFQKLHGKINAFANMCTFLKGFRFHQSHFLKKFANENAKFLTIPNELKNEIWIWAKAISENTNRFPIPKNCDFPGLFALIFVSDAAGMQNETFNDRDDVGCASLGLSNTGEFNFVAVQKWTKEFLVFANNNSGVLESIGLLLPFLCIPKKLQNKQIILQTDNLAVVFAWQKKYAKNDEKLTIFIQSLHLIECALQCKIFVEHVHRCSTPAAKMADALTRKSTTPSSFAVDHSHLKIHRPKSPLTIMYERPSVDWKFPLLLADHVATLKNCK